MSAELVRPIVEGWEQGDFRPRAELVADDLVVTGFTGSGDDVARGAEEIGRYLREFFSEWRDYRIKVERLVEMDDRRVLLEGRQYGVGRTSGISIDESLFVVLVVDDGRVRGMHWHPQRDGALEAAETFSG